MKKQLALALASALAVGLSSAASADHLGFDNGPPDGVNGYSNILDGGFGLDRRVADDFNLGAGAGFIIDIVEMNIVWGDGGANHAVSFLVEFFKDDAGGGPGSLVSSQVSTDFTETATGNIFFSRPEQIHSVDISPVSLASNTNYWVSIQPLGNDNCFQLTTGNGATNGDECYVNYVDLTGGLWVTGTQQFGVASDVVFRVNGSHPGDSCPWDLDDGGTVGLSDLLILLAQWGISYGLEDLLELLASWGDCP